VTAFAARKGRRLAAAIACMLASMLACTSSGPSAADRAQASVAANWATYQAAHGIPGGGLAVYLETPAGTVFAASGLPAGADEHSRFRIASNTKTFTASAIMMLAQQGRLDLDDTLVSPMPGQSLAYVPGPPEAAAPSYDIPDKAAITIRHLLSHTAGVFDVTNNAIPATCPVPYAGQAYLLYVLAGDPDHAFSPQELVGVDAACGLSDFAPGASYHYSNTGYSILATIIERVSGLAYDQYLVRNLIQPNGLASTSVPMLPGERSLPAPFVPGHLFDGGLWQDVTEDNMTGNIAEGNVVSTPADLARWVRRLVSGEAGPDAASVAAMMTTTALSGDTYGLGLAHYGGLGCGHTGAHRGYLSVMTYDAAAQVTTVAYFNLWDGDRVVTDQANLLFQAAKDARAAVGY
jgi:D-alanyl-D-alanine carboxypeptidase